MSKLTELTQYLDTYFSMEGLEADPAMKRFVPRAYAGIQYDYTQTFEDDFCMRFNGLMLKADDEIRKVFCISFPTPDVLKKILDEARGKELIFTHHPIDMAVAGAGFLPIAPEDLESLRTRGVSIYSCHTPLDCHHEVGTNSAIIQAFDGQVVDEFLPYGKGFAGRIVTILDTTFPKLLARGKDVFGVDRTEQKEGGFGVIKKIAVLAGGGDDADGIAEAEKLGAHAYITGEWYTRTLPLDPRNQEWAQTNREACQSFAEKSPMHFLGFSHPATEFLVMKTQIVDFFYRLGLEASAVPQDDWWR